ncbi:hypothetical protein DSO57_1023499 [Entomophthora muscae]|uniref:Uncharacterized protein n=1 Tax=Entomophthora muscae TaxID=34485 RepID=A0ACC2U1X1_9FUNG|nr:hypothetical protein DSO57_1023499 [Entomophthora muscae]
MLHFALANRCTGPGACIFDLRQAQPFMAFTHDLKESKTNTDAINVYKEVVHVLIDIYKSKDSYERMNSTMADSYIDEKYFFAANLTYECFTATFYKLWSFVGVKIDANEDGDLARQEFNEGNQELDYVYGNSTRALND